MKEKPSTESCILALIWLPVLLVLSAIWRGFVLTKLWGWFALPTFSLPMLSLPAAIGFALVVGFLTSDYNSKSDDDSDSLGEFMIKTTVKATLMPALSLFTGWIVSHYM